MEALKKLIEDQGTAFDEFKKTHTAEIVELKKKISDPLTTEKLAKIEAALDKAIEGKTKIEAAIEAEKKEREDLEARLSRPGTNAKSADQLVVEDFKAQLNARRRDLSKPPVEAVDEKMFADYKSALQKYMRKGRDELSPEEIKTLQVAVDSDGGYLVTPDVSGAIVKKVFESSPIRQIASAQTISTDRLEGIEDTGEAGAGYAGEKATSNDTTTPTIGKYSIPVWNIDTEPKATANLLDDAAIDVEGWLGGKVADKFARFENSEFCVGATKIRGFTSYDLVADTGAGVTWGSIGYIKTGASADFAATNPADKLFDLIGLVKEAYLPNSRIVTRRSVITKMRKFKSAVEGFYLWQPALVAGTPETFAGYPITRAEDMPALASASNSLAFGDFKAAYQIVDRQGNRVLRDPFTSKPFIKFYTTRRTGGGVVNFEALKILQFGT